jgi:hypothetical protein
LGKQGCGDPPEHVPAAIDDKCRDLRRGVARLCGMV